MQTRLFADCGATKCEWAIVKGYESPIYFESIGFNPNTYSEKEVFDKIQQVFIEHKIDKIAPEQVFFFGAGCGTTYGNAVVDKAFRVLLPEATIVVQNDIMGTAMALKAKQPIIACILGTGSASVFYNGKEAKTLRVSLGWTIGDEGSGCAIGKRILRNVFYKLWPEDILEDFAISYPGFYVDDFLAKIRENQGPNRFMASFAPFAHKHLGRDEVYREVYEELTQFVRWQVAPFCKQYSCKASFSGSVAYYFKEILERLAAEEGFEIEKIVAKPLPELIKTVVND